MKIETYEVEEIKDEMGIMAADSESAEIIAKLGLSGQESLLNIETCTRWPYRLMTPLERKVFSLCFPERTPLEKYSDGIIPLRVLQVAAYAKENSPEDLKAGLYVWHCGSAKEDPLLVGHTDSYGGKFYLLARWGDALPSMAEMIEKAKIAWKVRAEARAKKEINEWTSDLSLVPQMADEMFTTGKITIGSNSYQFDSL